MHLYVKHMVFKFVATIKLIARTIFLCGIPQERNLNTICLTYKCIKHANLFVMAK